MKEIVTIDRHTNSIVSIKVDKPSIEYSFGTKQNVIFKINSNNQAERDELIKTLVDGNNYCKFINVDICLRHKQNHQILNTYTLLNDDRSEILLAKLTNRLLCSNLLYIDKELEVKMEHEFITGLLEAEKSDAEKRFNRLEAICDIEEDIDFCTRLIRGI